MLSINRMVGSGGPFFPSCLPGTLLNTATYAQALSQVATLKGKIQNLLDVIMKTCTKFIFSLLFCYCY